MSAPHRGLPPPAAMSLPPQQPLASHPPSHMPSHQPPPMHHNQQPSMAQPPPAMSSHHHRDSWGSAPTGPIPLPPPPQHWSNTSDESMRHWLQTRAEEEKTRQEEEKTRQEGLRLEQRKIEMDMLQSSLSGGIPPPMIPLVFAGMANGALEWAQQFMASQSQYPQLPPSTRQRSPEAQRETLSQAPVQYHPSNPPAASGYAAYGTSPTRTRGQTVSGVMGRPAAGSNISSAGSNTPQSGQGLQPITSTLGPFQPQQPGGGQSSGQPDSNSSIYFHHWQPPMTQAGQASSGLTRPNSPPGEAQKKRKAGGDTTQHSRTSSTQRPRSPPPFIQSDFAGPSARKTHKRHKSDFTWYQGPRPGMGPIHEPAGRSRTPAQDNSSTSSKDRETAEGPRRGSQPETYSRRRHDDDGPSRERDRDREAAPAERVA